MGEVEFNADAAFISDYDAYKLSRFAGDFEQHGKFRFTLLRLTADGGWAPSFGLLCAVSAGLRSPANGARKNGVAGLFWWFIRGWFNPRANTRYFCFAGQERQRGSPVGALFGWDARHSMVGWDVKPGHLAID